MSQGRFEEVDLIMTEWSRVNGERVASGLTSAIGGKQLQFVNNELEYNMQI